MKLIIENLKKEFINTKPRKGFYLSIDELNIEENKIVYILGPNGSGKTTLLNLMQGFLESDSGKIVIQQNENFNRNNIDLLTYEPYDRAKYISYIPQDSDDTLVNELSIIEHMLTALDGARKIPSLFPRKRLSKTIEDYISGLKLPFSERLNDSIGVLSGGERQMVVLAMALIKEPQLLLFDEFTASLDPQMATYILDKTIHLIREKKKTALIVTHKHSDAIQYADRIIVLHQGKIIDDISRGSNVFSAEYLKERFEELYSGKIEGLDRG